MFCTFAYNFPALLLWTFHTIIKLLRDTFFLVEQIVDSTPINERSQYQDCMCAQRITKTYLHSFDPLKPHFYIHKLGFTGVFIIFLISAQNHRLWVLVRTASPRRFLRVPTIYVLSRNIKKIRVFYLKFFSFWK